MDFCKEFNARTAHLQPDTPTPVKLHYAADKTFRFETRTPPTTWLLKKAAGIDTGAGKTPAGKALLGAVASPVASTSAAIDAAIPIATRKSSAEARAARAKAKKAAGLAKAESESATVEESGRVTLKHVYEIAKIKQTDDHLKHVDLESLAASVVATSLTLGLRVVP